MHITLNGKKHNLLPDSTLADLITSIAVNPNHVIAEVNCEIVKSERWQTTVINQNDTVELVTFVGGG